MTNRRRIILGLVALLVGTAVWLPLLHVPFRPDVAEFCSPEGVPVRGRDLAIRQMSAWLRPGLREAEVARMRARNAEWDFMGRSFLVWSLANLALRDPDARQASLEVIDRIVAETLRLEEEHGCRYFLLPCAAERPFVAQPARSLFVDGEVALMLALRRMVQERGDYKAMLAERVGLIVARMGAGRVMCAESYPDECWTICNTCALAAVRVADHLDGTDHSPFFRRWVDTAKAKLIDHDTGLLVSSFDLDGNVHDGPEGSTIWAAAHFLQIIDEEFAADQYARARRELGRTLLGFGYAREWPSSWQGPADVDSGPIVPVLGISAGSSGLAFVGAVAFGDDRFLSALATSVEFGGFPERSPRSLRYCASNQVGDAVLLYSTVLGPAWEIVMEGAR